MQFTYNISLNSCQCLLRNYTKVKKNSNPKDYEGKIVFLSSNNPEYQSLYNEQFNIDFKAAYVQTVLKHCRASFNRNNHLDYEWKSFLPYVNESYTYFKVGNFSIDTKSFYNTHLQLQTFIPSTEQINDFEKSSAAKDYTYLSNGYFFDKSFPSKKLKRRLNDCTLKDKFVKFKVFNTDSISVLGVLENGNVKHFNYYTIDFSGIFDGKSSLNDLVMNFINDRKKQVYVLGFIVVIMLTILFLLCKRYYFSLFSFAIIVISTINIKAFCLQYFPIKFKPLFTATLPILISLLFLYSDKIPNFVNIMLLN